MMKMRGMLLAAALVLASGVSVLALADDDKDKPSPETKAAAAAVQKLADDVGKKDWDTLTKAGSEVAKKNELEHVMAGFKMRRVVVKTGDAVGGIGIGKVPAAITPDGIEAKISSLRMKPLAAKEQADLIRMAEITAAIAATSTHQCPVDAKMGKKDPAKWKEWSRDMYKSSQELIKALKAKDAKDIKSAASKLTTSCNSCHEIFRDDK